jgi:transcription-repair coupling factor (superfamily II helicase)
MVLPFVREIFADAEKIPSFTRVASHLKEGTGRISVSGLTPTAKAMLLVLWQRAAGRPLVIITADNRAVEEMVPVLRLPVTCCRFRISRRILKSRRNERRHYGR